MSRLDDFLGDLEDDGEFDSEGRFSLNLQKKALKLQRFALRNPEDYLLLCVRAAVAGGAKKIRISLSYQRALVDIAIKGRAAEELVAGFSSGDSSYGRGGQILAYAVGGAFEQGIGRVEIVTPDVRLVTNGKRLKGKARTGRKNLVRLYFQRRDQSWFGQRGRVAAEHRALCARCNFSPIPLILDGRTINDDETDWRPSSFVATGLPSGLILIEGFLRADAEKLAIRPKQSRAAMDVRGSELKKAKNWKIRAGAVFLRITEEEWKAYYRLDSLQGQGELVIVKDGVCLDPIENGTWIGGSKMVVRADQVETDISQLQPRESTELERLRVWTTTRNRELAKMLGREMNHLSVKPVERQVFRARASLSLGMVGFCAGWTAGPMGAVVLGGLGGLLGNSMVSSDHHGDLLEKLRRHLRAK